MGREMKQLANTKETMWREWPQWLNSRAFPSAWSLDILLFQSLESKKFLFPYESKTESERHSVVSDSLQPHGLYKPWNSPCQNTGVASLSLLQGIFPIQKSNPGLPHCRWILYQLSLKGSPRILEWVAYPFFSVSSWPRNQTGVSCIAGRVFVNWAMREAGSGSFWYIKERMVRNQCYGVPENWNYKCHMMC